MTRDNTAGVSAPEHHEIARACRMMLKGRTRQLVSNDVSALSFRGLLERGVRVQPPNDFRLSDDWLRYVMKAFLLPVARVWYCALLRMWCSAWSDVSSCVLVCVVLWLGRCGVAHSEGHSPPNPKGCLHSRHSSHALPTSWAPVQKRSWTLCPTLFAFHGSRRQWVVSPRTRVSRLLSNRLSGKTSGEVLTEGITLHAL